MQKGFKQKGGFNFKKTNDYSPEAVEQRRKKSKSKL